MNGLYNYGSFSNRQPQSSETAETTTPPVVPPQVVDVKIESEPNFTAPFEKKYHQRGTFYQRKSADNPFQQNGFAHTGATTWQTRPSFSFGFWSRIGHFLGAFRHRFLTFRGLSSFVGALWSKENFVFFHSVSSIANPRTSSLRRVMGWLPVGVAAMGVWYIWTHDFAIPVRLFGNDYVLGTRSAVGVSTNFEATSDDKLAFLDQKATAQPSKTNPYAVKTSLKVTAAAPVKMVAKTEIKPVAAAANQAVAKWGLANNFQNVSALLSKETALPKDKTEKYQDYIRRFAQIARTERDKFGIPASIKLAQGILESDAGESALTRATNNHFGIKTFKNDVPHRIFKDDTPNDKFCLYASAWESFRAHSQLLMQTNYKSLQFLSSKDYAGWAYGLQRCGYATDPQYAQKLIQIIRRLQLDRFDE